MAIRVRPPSWGSPDPADDGLALCDGLRALRAELALELLPAAAGRARLQRIDGDLVALTSDVNAGGDLYRQLSALHDVLSSHLAAEVDVRLSRWWNEERSYHLLERARQSVLAGLDSVVADLRDEPIPAPGARSATTP